MYPTPVGLALIEMIAERPERPAKRDARLARAARLRRSRPLLWRLGLRGRTA